MLNFAGTTHKQVVGVAVTPNIGVEVLLIDTKQNKVVKYARRALEYNFSTREIQDYGAFKSSVIDLFNELDIDTKSNVYVVLPNVHFDFMNLPLIIGDDAINNAILAKAEESYIFKRVEPISAWADLSTNTQTDSRYLVYSSFQKTAVDEIREAFVDIGSNLIGIETSYSAILRGIDYSGIVREEIAENYNWNLLLINTNSYALFSMTGNKLIDYTEVPLAIKSFSYEEAYQAITTSVSQILPNYPARKLLIVSQADDICAEVLKTQIVFDEEIAVLDCNKYSKKPFVDCSDLIDTKEGAAITLSALGASSSQNTSFPLELNVLGKGAGNLSTLYFTVTLFDRDILVTPELIRLLCYWLAGIFAGVFLALFILLSFANNLLTKNLSDVQTRTSQAEAEIAKLNGKGGVVDIHTLIDRINISNKKAIKFYDSVASDIPKNVWLSYYFNKDGDKLAVEGLSMTINDIYNYYKSLKVISPESSIQLKKLQIMTNMSNTDDIAAPDMGMRLFDFEIGNTESRKAQESKDAQNQQGANANQPNMQGQGDPNQQMMPPPIAPPPITPPEAPELQPIDMNN